jgi:GntR family transcriptional regulator / MocR family aminotransferase
VVVEDDYDSEYRYDERPLEPLQSLDRHGRVVYVGSFSKTLLPVLRLGFLVAPASLQPALRAAKQLTDWHGDPAAQAALAHFIDEGQLGRHVRKATRTYAARRSLLAETIRSDFAGLLELVPCSAGLHVCALSRLDTDDVVARASAAGVAVRSLESYCGETPRVSGLVFGYGTIPLSRIGPGLALLLNVMLS